MKTINNLYIQRSQNHLTFPLTLVHLLDSIQFLDKHLYGISLRLQNLDSVQMNNHDRIFQLS